MISDRISKMTGFFENDFASWLSECWFCDIVDILTNLTISAAAMNS